ncbi:MAG TPA: BREX-1 system phosphatase PglZ type B [Ruminiclostridium sp.]|nr:BREX-1 system phosphatase PglZ type B [Ruminiclostridium sp.]
MKVINHLINAIRASANYNPEVETRPYCILWTDKEKQWENAIPYLRTEMPELLVLDEYNPVDGKGPAIWLRTAIGGYVDGYTLPHGRIPILYLPGVSRQDIRAVEQCPKEFKPLAELQYSGVLWSQINARDWTVFAYLKTKKGGLGLEVAQDEATLQAIQRSLIRILDEKVDNLKGCHLDMDYFNSLISGVDTVRDILLWMSDPDGFKSGRSNEEWEAYVEICKSKYKFHPDQDGIYAATERLGWHDEAWDVVWNRFCEAPNKYDAIPKALRKIVMPMVEKLDRFPQWNEQQETSLRKELLKLSGMAEQNAREELLKLEQEHGQRRSLVWAELGQAPLAESLKWLSEMAIKTSKSIIGPVEQIAKAQETWGWQVDYSIIKALSIVSKQEDLDALFSPIRSIYLPWIDANARALQKAVQDNGYPSFNTPSYKNDECVCFVDGLRFDVAKILSEKLKAAS